MLQKKQVVYRIAKGILYPFRLAKSKHNFDIIKQMLDYMQNAIGEKKGNIEEKLQCFTRQMWQPKIAQVIIKLLLDRGVFQEDDKNDAEATRAKIFKNSQIFWSNLQTLPSLKEIAPTILQNTFKKTPNFKQSSFLLYKDLAHNQFLQNFETLTTENFIDWVDLSMAQSLLSQAASIKILFYAKLPKLKVLIRYFKCFGLIFEVKKNTNYWELLIYGPEAILENTRSYRVNFIKLLPAILLAEAEWQITTKIQFQGKINYQCKLSFTDNYKTFYKKENFIKQPKIHSFVKKWNQKNTLASVATQVFSFADNIYLLPDIVLTNKNGQKFYFEWVQYPLGNLGNFKKKIQTSQNNYFFLIIGAKKIFLTYFEKLLKEKKIICFVKNFSQAKLAELVN